MLAWMKISIPELHAKSYNFKDCEIEFYSILKDFDNFPLILITAKWVMGNRNFIYIQEKWQNIIKLNFVVS